MYICSIQRCMGSYYSSRYDVLGELLEDLGSCGMHRSRQCIPDTSHGTSIQGFLGIDALQGVW